MLTDLQIRQAVPGATISDGKRLSLKITKKGCGLWRWKYRFAGKDTWIALGTYPDVSLSEARQMRSDADALRRRGVDPATQRRLDRIAAAHRASHTFEAVAEEWLDRRRRAGLAEATIEKAAAHLARVYPSLGHRPISEITAPEVLAVLRPIESQGNYETVKRIKGRCSEVFRYAIATSRADRDPVQDLRGAFITAKVTHPAAIIEPSEIGALLRAIDGYKGHPSTRNTLRLLALTFARPSEIRKAEWAEMNLDAEVWTPPLARMKMRRPHRVPLSRQAVLILREQRLISGRSQFVFPSTRSVTRPLSENTTNGALQRLGYSGEEMTSHGFRAMATTRLAEMNKWPPDAIEKALSHVERNAVRAAYHREEFWAERTEMMQTWADYLDVLREENASRRSAA